MTSILKLEGGEKTNSVLCTYQHFSLEGERQDSQGELDNFKNQFPSHWQKLGVKNSLDGPSNLLYNLI